MVCRLYIQGVPKTCIQDCLTNISGCDISHLKGGIFSSVWSTKTFLCNIREPRYREIKIGYYTFRYWLISFLELRCLILFCLYFGSLVLYKNGIEPETYLRKDVSPPNKMFIARKIRNKSWWYQISIWIHHFKFFKSDIPCSFAYISVP